MIISPFLSSTTTDPIFPSFIDSTFIGQSGYGYSNANDGSGFAVYNEGQPFFLRCKFFGNKAGGWGGAGRLNDLQGQFQPRFEDCDFDYNTACTGVSNSGSAGCAAGAVYVRVSGATFRGCRFRRNTVVQGAYGGAVRTYRSLEPGQELRFEGCTFEHNAVNVTSDAASLFAGVGTVGGAIQSSASKVVLDGCLFRNNTAKDGGAINFQIRTDVLPPLQILNSSFEENTAGRVLVWFC
jgi:predicted outer membrane repeat protein